MDGNLLKSRSGIVGVSAVIVAEVAEGKAVQVPAMSGIAERAEIGIVRRDNHGLAARGEQAMELFHSSDDVRDMLDHVNRAHFAKRVIRKGNGY